MTEQAKAKDAPSQPDFKGPGQWRRQAVEAREAAAPKNPPTPTPPR